MFHYHHMRALDQNEDAQLMAQRVPAAIERLDPVLQLTHRLRQMTDSVVGGHDDQFQETIFRSFLRNELIKWIEMSVRPSVRLLTFYAFSISSLITGPSTLKFHMLILEMGPHNRSGPDCAISEGYPKKLNPYAVEALSLAHSLVLSLQIIYK